MARGAQGQGEPHDWVTRAADDAIRHAHDLYGADHVITCASGASPSGPIHLGNLREFLTVHFVAEEIRRRGIAVRHLHSWDDYDRFRKVPAGIDPSWSRAHRPAAVRRPRPVELPRVLGRALQGAAAGLARRARRGDGGGLADRAVPRRHLPRADPHRRAQPRPDRDGDGALPHQGGGRCSRERGGGGRDGRLRRQRRRVRPHRDGRDRRPGPVPLQALLPRLRPRHDDHHVVRRRHDRPRLHLHRLRVRRRHQPRHRQRGQAGLEGRLADALGVRGRRLRARRRRPRQPRLVVHRRQGAGEGDLRRPRAVVRRLLLRRRRRPGEDVVLARRRARPRPTRCRSSRRRSCAGSTCAASPSRRSTSTSAPRSCGCTTSGTRSARRPPTPRSATRRCWRSSAPRRPRRPAPCRRRPSSCRSGCCRRSPTSPPAAPS